MINSPKGRVFPKVQAESEIIQDRDGAMGWNLQLVQQLPWMGACALLRLVSAPLECARQPCSNHTASIRTLSGTSQQRCVSVPHHPNMMQCERSGK